MRDYILEQARSREQTFVFPVLRRIIRSYLAKRELRRMERLDDYILRDIGLTRDDLRYGLKLPYDVDPIAEIMGFREYRITRGGRSK